MPTDADIRKEKRRIFCVITQGEEGGAQRFVAQLAQHLNRDRFMLHVVWGSHSESALARVLPPHVTYATASHLVRNISPLSDIRAVYELRRQMTHFQPDVVLCISSKAGFVGALAANGLRSTLPDLKVIYRIGGWTFNDPWPAWKRRLYIWLEKWSALWKDIIVLNNSHDLDQAHRLGITPRSRIVRIYNGLDAYLPFLERDSSKAFLDHRVPESSHATKYDWLVGTIANLYETKDIPSLIGAAARVGGNVRFVVLGDGPQRRMLEQLILQYGLEDRFFLLGRIRDAWRYLTGLDVFVLPSVKEGFPWALLEAMAARVPVVATRVGAVPEMIEDGTSGILVEPGSCEQLAKGIVRLLGNDKLRQDLAIDAHQQVLNKFSLREMMSEYEKLLS